MVFWSFSWSRSSSLAEGWSVSCSRGDSMSMSWSRSGYRSWSVSGDSFCSVSWSRGL